MKIRFVSLIKIFCPLIIVGLILIIFLSQIESATYDSYTFRILLGGNELKIISGLDFVGDTIVIHEGDVRFNNNQYTYIVTNNKGKSYDIDFIMPEGDSFSVKQFNVSRVDFHNTSEVVAHGGNSSGAMSNNRNLLISAVLVHLRVLELYSKMRICFTALAIFIAMEYYFYLKPLFVYNVYCKLFKRKKGTPNIVTLKVANVLFMVVGSLAIFLLL